MALPHAPLVWNVECVVTSGSLDFLWRQEVKLHQDRFFRSLEEMKFSVRKYEPADSFKPAIHLIFVARQSETCDEGLGGRKHHRRAKAVEIDLTVAAPFQRRGLRDIRHLPKFDADAIDARSIATGQNVDFQITITQKKAAWLILIHIQPFRKAKVFLHRTKIGANPQRRVFAAQNQGQNM